MANIIKIHSIEHLTHDVLKIVTNKPQGYTYTPGQAVDFAINKPDWKDKVRAFTFTSIPEEDFLEFNIKVYERHNGVTSQLTKLKKGDEIILDGIFGDIAYKGEGIFLAGGAGITPFVSIFKALERKNLIGSNKLIFANKTKADIISEAWFKKILGHNFINVLSEEELPGYKSGYISADIIKEQIDLSIKYFYLCGPPPMMDALERFLKGKLNISPEFIVRENF